MFSELGVYITLLNDECLIKDCWERIRVVFPQVVVCDLGCTDDSLKNIKKAEVESHFNISPGEYANWKNHIGSRHHKIVWIDADELWLKGSLIKLKYKLKTEDQVLGHWRNLKEENGKLYASEMVCKGRFAWDTSKYMVGRTWPKERLYTLNKEDVPRPLADYGIYAWHGIFLKRSSVPEEAKRAEKRRLRLAQYSSLQWEEIKELTK